MVGEAELDDRSSAVIDQSGCRKEERKEVEVGRGSAFYIEAPGAITWPRALGLLSVAS